MRVIRQIAITIVAAALASEAPGLTFELPDVEFFSITNVDVVANSPTAPSVFTTSEAQAVSRVRTYHWNNGQGATPGTIWLLDDQGEIAYGPWQATGAPGQGGVPNAYWDAAVEFTLLAGTYEVMDSDPSTWAHNAESGGRGMTWLYAPSGTLTVGDPPDLGLSDTVGSIAWRLNGDVRESATVWVPDVAAATVETTLAIPTDGLRAGGHHVTIAAAGAGTGDPATFGHIHRFSFATMQTQAPDPREVAEIRWSIGGDPRTDGTVYSSSPSGAMIQETLEIPTPFLVIPPLAVPSLSGLEALVTDSAGNIAAGPLLHPLAGDPTTFDGEFQWPSFRLRQSGDYEIVIAPLSEDGIPGRYASASLSHAVPPYAEAIYADYWPPEDYPDEDLDFAGDANHDGVANGLAFALGFSVADPGVVRFLPTIGTEPEALLFTFRQRDGGTGEPGEGYGIDGTVYRVEASTNLSADSWTFDPDRISITSPPVDNGDGTETVTVRVLSAAQDSTFLRLVVETVDP